MLVVDAGVHEVLTLADSVELFEQHLLAWGSGAGQHLDLGVFGTESLASDHVAHVVLGNHRRLDLRQVVAVPHHGFVEVSAVLDEAGELVDGHLLGVQIR